MIKLHFRWKLNQNWLSSLKLWNHKQTSQQQTNKQTNKQTNTQTYRRSKKFLNELCYFALVGMWGGISSVLSQFSINTVYLIIEEGRKLNSSFVWVFGNFLLKHFMSSVKWIILHEKSQKYINKISHQSWLNYLRLIDQSLVMKITINIFLDLLSCHPSND